MVLSSDGKSQLLLELLHGEGTSVCHLPLKLQVVLAVRPQGSSCRAWVQHGGSQCQNPPAEFLGMQSKGIGISPSSTQSQLSPHTAQDWGQTSQRLAWTHCPAGDDHQCPPGDPFTLL